VTVAPPVLAAPARGRPPDRWLWAAAAAGWSALVLVAVTAAEPAAGVSHHDVSHHAAGAHPGGAAIGLHAVAVPAMVAAMAPLIAPNVRYAAMRSPARARQGVAVAVVGGWALVWLGAAGVLAIGSGTLSGLLGGPLAVAGATVVGVGWQWTRSKRRSVARCSRRLAPPLDRRAGRRASLRYGTALGRDCVVSCWPLMGLMTAARHSLPVAAMCLGVAWFERRRRPHHDPATGPTSLLIAAAGAGALLVGVPPGS
jgi:hypothetical protein